MREGRLAMSAPSTDILSTQPPILRPEIRATIALGTHGGGHILRQAVNGASQGAQGLLEA